KFPGGDFELPAWNSRDRDKLHNDPGKRAVFTLEDGNKQISFWLGLEERKAETRAEAPVYEIELVEQDTAPSGASLDWSPESAAAGRSTSRARVVFQGRDPWYLFRFLRAFESPGAKDHDREKTDEYPRGHTLRFDFRLQMVAPQRGKQQDESLYVVLTFWGEETEGLAPDFRAVKEKIPESPWKTEDLERAAAANP
ncbi:MAG: hypothetical protein JXA90_12970, partial [Planctomycetes bacterium]|nr:hypothetical protein [Planctomycetota bacterium]